MMHLDIQPSAGMIFPGPRNLILRGGLYRALELKVRHVARLEREAADVLAHPFAGLEDHLDAADRLTPGHPDRQGHLDALWAASDQWPPRLGSPMYWRALATAGVAPLYLRLALRASRPRLTAIEADALASDLSTDEWLAVDAIARGPAPRWEGGGDDRGMHWRSVVTHLTDRRRGQGLTLAEVADLYMGQLYFLLAGETPYAAVLPDRPEPIAAP